MTLSQPRTRPAAERAARRRRGRCWRGRAHVLISEGAQVVVSASTRERRCNARRRSAPCQLQRTSVAGLAGSTPARPRRSAKPWIAKAVGAKRGERLGEVGCTIGANVESARL